VRDKSSLPSKDYIALTLAACPKCYLMIYPDGKKSCRFLDRSVWWSPYWKGEVSIATIVDRTVYLKECP